MDRETAAAAYEPAAIEVLAGFAIEPAGLELVSVSENVTFRVTDAADGAAYVLRLHRPGYHTLEELESERAWTRALRGAGVAVPVPVTARDGRDYVPVAIAATGERRWAGITRWLEGRLLDEVIQETEDPRQRRAHFERVGRLAAAIHDQATGWRPPEGFRRHALDRDGLMGDAPFWGPFWTHPALSRSERRLLIDTRDRIRGALERYGRPAATYSMIHADLHPSNVLVDSDRLIVIDFDDAGFGWHPYEAAVALFRYRRSSQFAAIAQAFVDGYRSVRAMPEEVWALVPMFLLIRGMALIGWIQGRPELRRSEYLAELRESVCAECARFEPPC